MKRVALIPMVALALVTLTACGGEPNADEKTSATVANQQQIYTDNQPLPVYNYSAPREVMIQLYDAVVPKMPATWFVFMTQGVGATDSCAGMGVPIPYSTQLTNPEYIAYTSSYGVSNLPQPEPDSTYKPDATQATWVLCDYGNGLEPVYAEDQVRMYFHPVHLEGSKIVHDAGKPSVTIEVPK